MKSDISVKITLIIQLFVACSSAQFSLYQYDSFTGLYFTNAENVSENCTNLPEPARHATPPGSIKTTQCLVFFNDMDCLATDSFLVTKDSPNVFEDTKWEQDIPPRVVSYRACIPSDKYLYPYPIPVVYTDLSSKYISGFGDELQVQQIFIRPGCTPASVPFTNVMALSSICVKLYGNSDCKDSDPSFQQTTLQPWQPKPISYFGYLRSLQACDEEDLYKPHKKPESLDTSELRKTYTTGGRTGSTSYRSRNAGETVVLRILFAIVGFFLFVGGVIAKTKGKNSTATRYRH